MSPVKILYSISVLLLGACNVKTDRFYNSNERMIQILDSINKQNHDKDNPYFPQAQLDSVNNKIEKTEGDLNERISAENYKAATLLKVGNEKEAIEIYEQLSGIPQIVGTEVYDNIMANFALANMRYGERTNCINNHMAESCVFPIKATGMHQDETGSRKAIEIYEKILRTNPTDLSSRWLLNIAYMTLGEYPAKVPAELLIPGLDTDSSGVMVKPFTDVASALRLNTRNRGGGVITEDFNNDGYLDIVTSDWGLDKGVMHFFINNTNGGFTDVTSRSGLDGYIGGLNMIQADYNNDGFIDILILRGAWLPGKFGKQPNSLLRNNGNGTFTDVTEQSGLLSFHPTQTAVWRDFNNDGWLDLFIGNETFDYQDKQPCELYISNCNGTFTNVAKEAGCDVATFVKGVTSADYNNDGYQDIFLSTYDGSKILLKNKGLQNGKVHFKNVTQEAGLNDIHVRTFPTWFWDYDNDGYPDIFVCGYDPGHDGVAYNEAAEALHRSIPWASKMYLYHNNRNGTFSNVSKEAGLDKFVSAMGSNFGDFDNDGYLDMYLGTGNPELSSLSPNRLYKNMQGKKFVDVTPAARVGNLQKGHAVSFTDLDNDGDQDIYIVVGGAFIGDAYYNSLYLNPGQNNNRWINLSLQGDKSNRSAIGAEIKISFRENGVARTIYRDENSGGSFGSSALRREIGLGKANIIDRLDITWPGTGATQTFKNIKPNQFYRIKEGNNQIEKVNLKMSDFKGQDKNGVECGPTAI